jgi:hypothetical protein
MRQDTIYALENDMALRIEKLVHRRSDSDNDRTGARYVPRRVGKNQTILAKCSGQQVFGAVFDEGKAASPERGQGLNIQVVDVDSQALARERQDKRDANVARATNDGQIRSVRVRLSNWNCKIGSGHDFTP